jgi:type I restriction enzyme, S subunit
MSELPKGWSITKLGNLVEILMGQAPPGKDCNKEGTGTPFVKAGEFGSERPMIREWTTKPLRISQRGDVLLCVVGATCGKINLGEDCAIGRSVAALRPQQAINQNFLYRYLSTKVQHLRAGSVGSAQGVISKEDIATIEFPLPPLPEQHRIVAKLDSLLARSRRAREELERVPGLCDRYKQAVLAAACSGRLTADWRTEQCLEMDWQSTILGELIIDKPKNGYSAKPVNYETPFRVLSLTATTSGKFDSGHFKYFDESIDEESPFWLRPNDILVQRGNTIEYVGVSAIYDGLPKQFIFPDLMMRLRAQSCITTQFLHMVLSCEKSRKYLRSNATGTAGNMPKINQTTLIGLPVDLPSIEEQKEIVQRVEKLFKAIDSIAQDYQKARQLLDRLDQATLAKAFRGELVPQDPNDEPAAALLERIHSEKQAEPKGKAVRSKQKRGGQQ